MRFHIGGGRGEEGFSRFVSLHIVKQHAASRKGDTGGMFPEKCAILLIWTIILIRIQHKKFSKIFKKIYTDINTVYFDNILSTK